MKVEYYLFMKFLPVIFIIFFITPPLLPSHIADLKKYTLKSMELSIVLLSKEYSLFPHSSILNPT